MNISRTLALSLPLAVLVALCGCAPSSLGDSEPHLPEDLFDGGLPDSDVDGGSDADIDADFQTASHRSCSDVSGVCRSWGGCGSGAFCSSAGICETCPSQHSGGSSSGSGSASGCVDQSSVCSSWGGCGANAFCSSAGRCQACTNSSSSGSSGSSGSSCSDQSSICNTWGGCGNGAFCTSAGRCQACTEGPAEAPPSSPPAGSDAACRGDGIDIWGSGATNYREYFCSGTDGGAYSYPKYCGDNGYSGGNYITVRPYLTEFDEQTAEIRLRYRISKSLVYNHSLDLAYHKDWTASVSWYRMMNRTLSSAGHHGGSSYQPLIRSEREDAHDRYFTVSIPWGPRQGDYYWGIRCFGEHADYDRIQAISRTRVILTPRN